jgi:hypothetical protein
MRFFIVAVGFLATLIGWEFQRPVLVSAHPESASPSMRERGQEEETAVKEEFYFLPCADGSSSSCLPAPFAVAETDGFQSSTFKTEAVPNRLAQVPSSPVEPTGDLPILEENQPLDPQEVKEELGEIEIIQPSVRQPPPRPQPNLQLLLRSSVFSSSNITGLEFIDRDDTVFVNSASLLATPKLGESTRLIAAASGGLVRFASEGDANYNFLTFNVGVQQKLTPQMYGQLGWVQDRLYREGSGDRLLVDDSVRLIVGRQDILADRLRLDSFYEFRASFADPDEQSRIANSLGARLRYDLTPQLQGTLGYQLTFNDFTQQERFDTQHRLSAEAIYSINRDLFISGSASYLFGSSSASSVDLSNFAVGLNVGLNLPLF